MAPRHDRESRARRAAPPDAQSKLESRKSKMKGNPYAATKHEKRVSRGAKNSAQKSPRRNERLEGVRKSEASGAAKIHERD
jgi:hypothetical protein